MTEPDQETRQTPFEVCGDLAYMIDQGKVRGVVVQVVGFEGEGFITIGGMVFAADVQRAVTTLQTLLANSLQLTNLMGMDVEGHG